MSALAKGIAHVSFTGGGIFLPARSPYDRQMLIEHVTTRARAQGVVQVLIDDDRWMVRTHRDGAAVCCARCGHSGESACYSDATGDAVCCPRCAFGDYREPAPAFLEQLRQAS